MLAHLNLAFSFMTLFVFVVLLYLHLKLREPRDFFYTSLFVLCGAVILVAQYHLELGVSSGSAVFWSKFQYLGIFGYIYTFPLFVSNLVRKKLAEKTKTLLSVLTLVIFLMIIFTNLIISNQTGSTLGLRQAEKGILYPLFITVPSIIIIYYFLQIFLLAKNSMPRPESYNCLIFGIGSAIFLGILDLIGFLLGKPVIPGIRTPFTIGIFVSSLAFAWTIISKFYLIIRKLDTSENEIVRLTEKTNKNFVEFVQLIAKTLDAKDHYTAGHSLRVMDYASKIARALNLPNNQIELLKHACLLHDIGKIGIPDGILNKKSPLAEKERKHITNHPVIGKQILSTMSEFQDILEIVQSHHERIDGYGYPNGLEKEEIPLLARILAVADTYDAMRSERPYRRARTKEEALLELHNVKDKQLDGPIVETFIQILESQQ